ncbi:MAG: hypothetical protein ABGZ17_21835 [Planctomycetaceae bacterium]
MTDPLPRFWSLLDSRHPLSLREPNDALPWIRETTPAQFTVCPDCDAMHEERPVVRTLPEGSTGWYIPCPELLRVEIDPECLRRWNVDFNSLAVDLGTVLGLTGLTKELVPGRLWRLGQTSRDVLLARGLHWSDASDITPVVERSTQPIVLVPEHIPDATLWTCRTPAVVALSHVSQLSHGGLAIDHTHLFAAVSDQQQQSADANVQVITGKKQKLMIRRQIKAEIESMLTDDALVAAYGQHGSYRKAAEALSDQTGQFISKDKVARAVKRKGGPQALGTAMNSDSVRRTVASQRRDGKKKIQNRPEAMDW